VSENTALCDELVDLQAVTLAGLLCKVRLSDYDDPRISDSILDNLLAMGEAHKAAGLQAA
jgi:hypothetical protein